MNRIDEINARLSAIAEEIEKEGADLDALEQEIRSLNEEKRQLQETAEKRQALKASVAAGAGMTVRSFKAQEKKEYSAASPEYKRAWLKNIAVDETGKPLFDPMDQEERAAFTFLTTNTSAVVPTDILNRIVELVESESPLLEDATMSHFTRGFAIPRHKSIAQGDAAAVDEGAANDDEEDIFDQLPLDGVEIKKHVVMSRKMEIQSLEAFEDWLTTHLADRIRVAKEARILSQLSDEDYGIAEDNAYEIEELTDAAVRAAFAKIRQNGAKVIYANSGMIWEQIAGLENLSGQKLFIPNAMSDPKVAGRVYGAVVKEDNNIPDGVLYIGVPKSILCNEFDSLVIVPALEPKTLKRIFTGYSLFDAGLENPLAFVKLTVNP